MTESMLIKSIVALLGAMTCFAIYIGYNRVDIVDNRHIVENQLGTKYVVDKIEFEGRSFTCFSNYNQYGCVEDK